MNILVGISDMKISRDKTTVFVAHSLGACIGVAVYDSIASAGGLLHFMFPDSRLSPGKAEKNPSKFADTGIAKLLEELYKLGCTRDGMKAVIAGGSEVIGQLDFLNIGKQNYKAAKKILSENNIDLCHEDIGKNINRTLKLELKNGQTSIIVAGQEEKKVWIK